MFGLFVYMKVKETWKKGKEEWWSYMPITKRLFYCHQRISWANALQNKLLRKTMLSSTPRKQRPSEYCLLFTFSPFSLIIFSWDYWSTSIVVCFGVSVINGQVILILLYTNYLCSVFYYLVQWAQTLNFLFSQLDDLSLYPTFISFASQLQLKNSSSSEFSPNLSSKPFWVLLQAPA